MEAQPAEDARATPGRRMKSGGSGGPMQSGMLNKRGGTRRRWHAAEVFQQASGAGASWRAARPVQ